MLQIYIVLRVNTLRYLSEYIYDMISRTTLTQIAILLYTFILILHNQFIACNSSFKKKFLSIHHHIFNIFTAALEMMRLLIFIFFFFYFIINSHDVMFAL